MKPTLSMEIGGALNLSTLRSFSVMIPFNGQHLLIGGIDATQLPASQYRNDVYITDPVGLPPPTVIFRPAGNASNPAPFAGYQKLRFGCVCGSTLRYVSHASG